MRRFLLMTLSTLAVLAAMTYRVEHHSRYHYDSLRQERFVTTRILGIPVHTKTAEPHDPFSGVYLQIMLRPPDEKRWRVMCPDFVRSPFSAMNICYGFGLSYRERRELIETVFARFIDDHDRVRAASFLASIDAVLPMPADPNKEPDIAAIDDLRDSLGLERHIQTP
ncbi:MAG: hypothetical protein IAE77_26470 [Prosthecobacter sp.]|nr:hypothetical protein [Prosthecobacter sp.]